MSGLIGSNSTASISTIILRKLKAEEKELKCNLDASNKTKTKNDFSHNLSASNSLPHIAPPSCLSKFIYNEKKKGNEISAMSAVEIEAKERDAMRRKSMNEKLKNSLFLSTLDMEEVHSSLEHGNENQLAKMGSMSQSQAFAAKYYNAESSSPKIIDSSINLFTDLSDHDMDTYFGQEARVDFCAKYRQMAAAKMKISASSISYQDRISTPTKSLGVDIDEMSEAEKSKDSESQGGDDESSDDNENNSIATASHLNFSDSTNQASDEYISRIMNRNCNDFYRELQSFVSGSVVSKEIDRSLLSFDSFKDYSKKFEGIQSSHIMIKKSKKKPSSSSKKRRQIKSKGIRLPPLSPIKESSWLTRDNVSVSTELSLLSQFTSSGVIQSSPRTKYLSGCIRDGLLPLPNLILRKNFTKAINLAHMGIGDKMGRVLAECLQELPIIESVNLNDNNLTDDSLKYLIDALVNIKTLTSLDLSRNKIDGDSSDSLADYVSREDCPLLILTLQSADVDDGECDGFVQCLVTNRQLRQLDLSSNLLGTSESKGDPTAPSGPGSIATYLKSTSCRLEVLKVAWNSIRMNSAVVLCSSLAYNSTVTYLDISCNGLGWAAGEVLGDALMENRTLQTLIASNNNFSSSSIMSICIGIVENLAMRHVSLNENPIGIAGARAILQLSMVVGSRATVSAANCNTIANDDRCWYDPDQPCKEYDLDLSKAFDRAVAFHLTQTIANHSTFVFEYVMYEESPGSKQPQTLNLKQVVFSDREKYFDDEQMRLLAGLRRMKDAASNVELGTQLFYEADADGSGKLDKDELQEVLEKIGFEIDDDQLHDIFTIFDVDGAGAIDKAEFLSLLKSQRHEANLRINDMINYPVMALDGKRYIPPRKGILRMKVIDGFVRKKTFYTLSSLDTKYAYRMAKGIGDVTMMTDATKNSKTRYNEAYNIYKTIYKELGDKAAVLIRVVPGMMNPGMLLFSILYHLFFSCNGKCIPMYVPSGDARQLISKVTNDDRMEIARIRMAFGASFRPMLGSFNGFYTLDLSKEMHRQCLAKLLEQSQTMNHKRKSSSIIGFAKVGDLSQHGNWSSFRNEIYNGEVIEVTPTKFTPIPHSGILEFDFSGGNRPTGGELVLSDKRLCKVLDNINLIKVHDEKGKPVSGVSTEGTQEWALKRLKELNKNARVKSKDGKTSMPMFQVSPQRALDIGAAADDFYNNVKERGEMHRIGMRMEEVKYDFMNDDSKESGKGEEDEKASGGGDKVEASDEQSIGSHDSNDQNVSDAKMAVRQRKIAEIKQRYYKLLHFKKGIPAEAKAARFVELIDETFSLLWIRSRHVAVMVLLFKQLFGECSRSEFYGSYAIDMVVFLFARIIDLHNFETVMETLNDREIAVLYARIGILNIFNPMKPENSMELNLERRDERIVAKMIVYLSADEPGINLTYKRFQWKRGE